MSIQSEITRISNNVQNTIDVIEQTGVSVPAGANSDALPSLAQSLANEKQDKLTGTQGQVVGFDEDGNAVPQAAGVTSFNGRTGAVTPQSGDYTAEEVGAAKPGNVFTVTLTAAGWSSNSQTVSDKRFLASGYAYFTNPADDDFTKWGGAIVRGQDVTTNGQMTFTCEETPAENISVKILRVEADEA